MTVRITVINNGRWDDANFKELVRIMRNDLDGSYVSDTEFDMLQRYMGRLNRYRTEKDIDYRITTL